MTMEKDLPQENIFGSLQLADLPWKEVETKYDFEPQSVAVSELRLSNQPLILTAKMNTQEDATDYLREVTFRIERNGEEGNEPMITATIVINNSVARLSIARPDLLSDNPLPKHSGRDFYTKMLDYLKVLVKDSEPFTHHEYPANREEPRDKWDSIFVPILKRYSYTHNPKTGNWEKFYM